MLEKGGGNALALGPDHCPRCGDGDLWHQGLRRWHGTGRSQEPGHQSADAIDRDAAGVVES